MEANKKIVVFGVFDGLHPGHRNFLEQASAFGDEINAIVARDSVVGRLKSRKTKHSETKRVSFLDQHELIAKVFLGDETEGEYLVLKNINPDLICLGYDQQALYQDLKTRINQKELPAMELSILDPHEPEKYHSSLFS